MEKIDQVLYDELYLRARTLLSHGTETDMIEKHLLQNTDDPILIAIVIRAAKKDHYEDLRTEGFKYITIGVVLILVGFLITFLNFNSGKPFIWAMYGCTSVGACFVFFGLYKLIG